VFARDADALARQRNWPALASLAGAWTRSEPENMSAWRSLSRAEFETGRFRRALEAYRVIVERAPRTAADLTVFGRIALHAQEFDIASAALREAETLDPRAPEMLAARAQLLTYLGEFDEAIACCRRCIAASPEYAPAYALLGRLTHGAFTPAEMHGLSRIARQPHAPLDHRISASFALAQGLEAQGDVDGAFRTFTEAHDLAIARDASEGRRYDRAAAEERVQRLRETTVMAEPAPDWRKPGALFVPIFIVGMPRSGTTLVEAMLSAHSQVRAGGERPEMQQILDAWVHHTERGDGAGLAPGLAENWVRMYAKGAPGGNGAGFVTDKHPLNLEAAGLIAQLFPAATIINVRRNPLETALSIYRNEFSKFWAYTHRLADIGHQYGLYARLARHWERALGARFLTVQYEDFAANFATAAPALVAACGLPWEPRCLDFQHVNRPIPTLSAVQARGPVRPSAGAAAKYARWTGPLVAELESAGVDLATGALQPGDISGTV
jgi:tetratricopeptide (TPR) repeat protein